MFEVTDEELRRGMEDFMEEMARGLDDPSTSTLYMEPCYVALPSGKERGKALALDFGGTNARASLIELTSDGLHVVRQVARPLRKAGAYDVTTKDTSREALFDFLAELVADVLAGEDTALPLGHTFSYGTHQEELRDARLLVWSKEIVVPGVEGEMVNALLEEALRRKRTRRHADSHPQRYRRRAACGRVPRAGYGHRHDLCDRLQQLLS